MTTIPDALTPVRLKGVVEVSFQRSEATNLGLYRKENYFPGELGEGEAFLFISKGADQVIFVFRSPLQFETRNVGGKVEKVQRITDSRRLRLDNGVWSPYMLQNYANRVGIYLIGIKRFEQICDERKACKKNKKAGA